MHVAPHPHLRAALARIDRTAEDGLEAVALFKKHRAEISCVMMDLTMPVMDGEEAFLELRKVDPEVKVIMCSGYSEKEVERRFFGKEMAVFLAKPYTLSAMREALARLMTSPR